MIRQAHACDIDAVTALARALWPDSTDARDEMASALADGDAAVFLYIADGTVAGFAQCGLRFDYVEGARTSPVGYLEGIYVRKEHRGEGAGRALCGRCEAWARDRGCAEFASDCEADNAASIAFHARAGFSEANRIVCFCKKL